MYDNKTNRLFEDNPNEHFNTDRRVPKYTARQLRDFLNRLPDEYLDYYMVMQREQHFYDVVEVEALDEVYYRLFEGNQALISKEYYYANYEEFKNIPVVYALQKGQLIFSCYGKTKH